VVKALQGLAGTDQSPTGQTHGWAAEVAPGRPGDRGRGRRVGTRGALHRARQAGGFGGNPRRSGKLAGDACPVVTPVLGRPSAADTRAALDAFPLLQRQLSAGA
jgi:hypothetical protein